MQKRKRVFLKKVGAYERVMSLNGIQLAASRVITGKYRDTGERRTGCFGNPGAVPRQILFPHGQKNLWVTLTTTADAGTCYTRVRALAVTRTRNVRSITGRALALERLGEESERSKRGNVRTDVVDLGKVVMVATVDTGPPRIVFRGARDGRRTRDRPTRTPFTVDRPTHERQHKAHRHPVVVL